MFNTSFTKLFTKPDKDKQLIDQLKSYTFCSEAKLRSLIRHCEYIEKNNLTGDIVECGTYKGGSAAVLAAHMSINRRLWLYDSFEGMPGTTVQDGEDAKAYIGEGAVALECVYEALGIAGADLDKVIIKKGWFDYTFKQQLPTEIALLHCDADWYESVLLTLETFYPLVKDGGVVILDDFGYWEGCRVAFYDFCAKHKIAPLVERVSMDQLYWVKNKDTNRG